MSRNSTGRTDQESTSGFLSLNYYRLPKRLTLIILKFVKHSICTENDSPDQNLAEMFACPSPTATGTRPLPSLLAINCEEVAKTYYYHYKNINTANASLQQPCTIFKQFLFRSGFLLLV